MDQEAAELVVELSELFGPDPETLNDELLGELFDELGSLVDTEVALILLGLLLEVAGEWPPQLARCERHLGAVADRVTGPPQHVLRGGVDLMLGLLAAEHDRWEEAATRLGRAYAGLDPVVFADHMGDCENALGEIAFREGDAATARRHFEAAQAAYRTEALLPIASVTARLGELAERDGDPERAGRLWGRAADLLSATGEIAGAAEAAEHACRLTLTYLRGLGEPSDTGITVMRGPADVAFLAARDARELAVRHDVRWAAVELLTDQATLGADRGMPWAQAVVWFDQARAEALDVPASPERTALFCAAVDFAQGSAALGRGMPVEAEGPLRAALPAFRAHGHAVEAALCERLLIGVRSYFEPELERPARDAAGRTWADPESGAAASAIAAVGALRRHRAEEADESLDRARMLLSGDELRLLAVDALDAWRALDRGDPDAAQRCVRRIEESLPAMPGTFRGTTVYLAQLAGLLRAALAQRAGDHRRAADELSRVEDDMQAVGAGLFAAQLAVVRGIGLLERGDAAVAARVLVPAVLALDAVRFTLDDAERRALWSASVASGFAAALRAAAASRDTVLLAELIEVARANAIPTPRPGDAAPTLEDLLGDVGRAGEPGRPLGTLPGSAVLGGAAHRTEMGVPAQLRTPWGTLALAGPLDAARRYHAPLRSADVVNWTVP